MSKSTISTFQLFALFPDEESARVYLEGRIWPSGPICPACQSGEHISALGTCATRKAGFYRCLPCGFDFTVRTNTVMERQQGSAAQVALLHVLAGHRAQGNL